MGDTAQQADTAARSKTAEHSRVASMPNAGHATTEWLGIEALAGEIGVPVRTIYAWRTKGKGPRAATFGKHVRFRRADVEAWIESRLDDRTPAA